MNSSGELTPVCLLVLGRLLVASDAGATGNDLKKALEPLIGDRWQGAELTRQLDGVLANLSNAGLVTRTRKGRTDRAALTSQGRRAILERLGLERLTPKTTWDKLKKTYLAALALGLRAPAGDAARRFAGDPGFKAALMKGTFGLPLDDYPSLDVAIDALAWTLLGFRPGPKFQAKAVQTALIRRALGDDRDAGPKPDP
jgi:DNA-binding PadR family transcriptional regulator